MGGTAPRAPTPLGVQGGCWAGRTGIPAPGLQSAGPGVGVGRADVRGPTPTQPSSGLRTPSHARTPRRKPPRCPVSAVPAPA